MITITTTEITIPAFDLRADIPAGKTRVIYVDEFSGKEGVVKDCDTPEEAVLLADEKEDPSWVMGTTYHVYDEHGDYIFRNDGANGPY